MRVFREIAAALGAWWTGWRAIGRAPALIVLAYAGTLLVVAPLTLVMTLTLRDQLDRGHPARVVPGGIDGDWWLRQEESAAPLAALFAPRAIGAAAALDTLDVVLDAEPPPPAVLAAAAAYGAFWAWLWPVALSRFAGVRAGGVHAAWQAGRRWLGRSAVVMAMAGAVTLALYVTAHPLLVQWLSPQLASGLDAPAALVVRAAGYAAFAALLVAVAVAADLTRIGLVLGGDVSVGTALTGAVRLLRDRPIAVAGVCLLTLLLALLALIGYLLVEQLGGARVGGWRGVVLAQAFIGGRIILRLQWGASLLAIYAGQRGRSASPAPSVQPDRLVQSG